MAQTLIRIHREPTSPLVRHETFEGRDHLVVPTVMVVEGVLNGALVSAEELAASAESWNGRPVPILHPQERGEYVTANDPKIIERGVVGQLFSAKVEGSKLKGELWIDIAKAEKLGHGKTIKDLEAGTMVEVSTGYFCDETPEEGEFKGIKYSTIHRNLRPDHLALLPGEIGACSVEDGCGAPRINNLKEPDMADTKKTEKQTEKQTVKLGSKIECPMCDKAKALHANGPISAKELETFEEIVAKIGVENIVRLAEVFSKLAANPEEEEKEPTPEPAPEPEEEPVVDTSPTSMNIEQITAMVKRIVAETLPSQMTETTKRMDVTNRLRANERNPLTEAEMAATPISTLEKMEQSLRPMDYSGRGGFAANCHEPVEPLLPPVGILSVK